MKAATDIRPALPADAGRLSSLALRSKAHWGYGPEFIEQCREELRVTPEQVESKNLRIFVAHRDGEVLGYYALELGAGGEAELEAMFVEPSHIGSGVGARLMRHAVEEGQRLGLSRIVIQADPHAEAFYRAHGAVPVGLRESGSIPGRALPVLHLELSDRPPTDRPSAGPVSSSGEAGHLERRSGESA